MAGGPPVTAGGTDSESLRYLHLRRKDPTMARARVPRAPRVGDRVTLRGTRIVGDVKQCECGDREERVRLKVIEVRGKPRTSKTARAWQGAWVTCVPEMVAPLDSEAK